MAIRVGWRQVRQILAMMGLAALLGTGLWSVHAGAAEAPVIGVLDGTRLLDEYLGSELDRARAELQAEFDAKAKGLSQEEQANLFQEYQARLYAIRDGLLRQHLPAISEAIATVAKAKGVTVVLDENVVHFGGIDLTDDVLAELGIVTVKRAP